jgi:ubiquinone/menaquinone biosynthesis C-methylase UbiE
MIMEEDKKINSKEFQDISYKKHETHYSEYISGDIQNNRAKTWFDKDTVDAWRHYRMYTTIAPFLNAYPDATWVTIGDGRYGKDAKFILEKGCKALATDISDILLKEAKDIGYIEAYQRENAEKLSFSDSQFDFVLCKESYHHFPRPMLALYEMLRVAKEGVILIEPNDHFIFNSINEILFRFILNKTRLIFGKKPSRGNDFEEVGNYVYRISEREIEKVAVGLNYRAVAFKGLNDCYIKGVEDEKIMENGRLFRKVKRRIRLQDLLARLEVRKHTVLVAVILKKSPNAVLRKLLVHHKYNIVDLPENPYINSLSG